eukprot:912659_1
MVRNRFCSSNSSFFKSWNPCMAYWLGFLFADGNINDSQTNYVVQLQLKCIDYSHVEKYKKALQSTYHLALYTNNISSMTILTWMYKDSNSTIRLDRKYALYSKFTETANLKPKP